MLLPDRGERRTQPIAPYLLLAALTAGTGCGPGAVAKGGGTGTSVGTTGGPPVDETTGGAASTGESDTPSGTSTGSSGTGTTGGVPEDYPEIPGIEIHRSPLDAEFGSVVDAPGDVDGDGLADLLLGDCVCGDVGCYGTGMSLVFGRPGRDPVDTSVAGFGGFSITGSEMVGCWGGGIGDIDGDGHSDLYLDGGVILLGKADGADVQVTTDQVNPPTLTGAEGIGVSGVRHQEYGPAGDYNGDGTVDAVVPGNEPGVYALVNGASGLRNVDLGSILAGSGGRGLTREDDATLYWPDNRLDALPDLNGDGYDELLVPGFVVWGGQTVDPLLLGSAPQPAEYLIVDRLGDSVPSRLRHAGDVDGDGLADVLVDGVVLVFGSTLGGESIDIDDAIAAGGAVELGGDPRRFPARPAWDLNGDGKDDLLVRGEDSSVVLWGGADISMPGDTVPPEVGRRLPDGVDGVMGVGDFDGDGVSDLLVRWLVEIPDSGDPPRMASVFRVVTGAAL